MRVAPDEAEIARGRLLALAPAGFEETGVGGDVEFSVYTDAAGAAALRRAFAGAVSSPVAAGWEDRWRSFHRPVVAGGIWIGPPWETIPSGTVAVIVDPGRAFGTGAHPTTRACIELLAREERGSVLDAGCGSGVVALAAARLGFAPVVGVDADPVAVETARKNAVRNGVSLDVRKLDALRDGLPAADLLAANIELAAVEALLRRRPAARAITSGYLAGEVPAHGGWRVRETLELEGWAAHALEAL